MTVEELNRKADRLVELCKERLKIKNCRRRMFEQIFGPVFDRDVAYDMYMRDWEYPQDSEIEDLNDDIDAGLQELGFSNVIIRALNIEGYSNIFCVDYVPHKSKSEFWFKEES